MLAVRCLRSTGWPSLTPDATPSLDPRQRGWLVCFWIGHCRVDRQAGDAPDHGFVARGSGQPCYLPWEDALIDGERLGLLNTVECVAAKALPPELRLHTKADVDLSKLSDNGFISGKTPPPQ